MKMVAMVNPTSKFNAQDNPVQGLWVLALLLGSIPGRNTKIYAVRFTSTLAGNYSRTSLEVDLYEKPKEELRELNFIGVMERRVFTQVLEYVKFLKLNGIFESVDSLLPYLDPDAGEMESQKLYEELEDAIFSDLDMFPTVSSGMYERGVSDGVILDTQEYITKYELRDGAGAVAVTTEFVKDILGLEETRGIRYLETTRSWLKNGYLLKRDKGKRLQDVVYHGPDRDKKQRFFIIWIPELQARLDQAHDDDQKGSDHE